MFDESTFAPFYNVAPQSMQPVVRLEPETGERELTAMRWGLVPFWSNNGKGGDSTPSTPEPRRSPPALAFREEMKLSISVSVRISGPHHQVVHAMTQNSHRKSGALQPIELGFAKTVPS